MKNLLHAFMTILGTALTWQAMDEIYKFDKADYFQVTFSMFMSLVVFFGMFNNLTRKETMDDPKLTDSK